MAGYTAAAILALKAVQVILLSLQEALAPGAYLCPRSTTIETINGIHSWDYILIGTGSAGSVVAFRLAETSANVLVLEEGECPPLESNMPGYFTLLPLTVYDRAMNFYNDSYAFQNQKPEGGATAGVMLGGTGSIGHMLYIPPNEDDYHCWGEAAGDAAWTLPKFAKYFAKGEKMEDRGVLAQKSSLHGTNGPTLITKQESDETSGLITAHEELGIKYLNDTDGLCTSQPTLLVGDGLRQSGTVAYLRKISGRSNVRFLTGAIATRILFEGTTATGVEFAHKGATHRAMARKRVIVSAGAIKTPQLLMLSGIGDKATLAGLGIESVVHNREVGRNLADHVAALVGISLDRNTQPAGAADPHKWPVPMITVYDALNRSRSQPELQNIILFFGPNSTGQLQLCSYGFKYVDGICDAWYEGNIDRNIIISVLNYMHPKSKGSVTLNSTDIKDQPTIKMNFFGDGDDLNKFAQLLLQYVEPLLKTNTMINLGAKFIDLGLCENYDIFTLDYWKCYIVKMSSTMWHFSGTCAMGKVVDGNLNVIGAQQLMVADASVIPSLTSGNIESTVRAIAEKASDIIKQLDGW